MNNTRRTKIRKALDLLEEVTEEEREAYDNIPKNLLSSTKAETMESVLDDLEEVKNTIDDILAN